MLFTRYTESVDSLEREGFKFVFDLATEPHPEVSLGALQNHIRAIYPNLPLEQMVLDLERTELTSKTISLYVYIQHSMYGIHVCNLAHNHLKDFDGGLYSCRCTFTFEVLSHGEGGERAHRFLRGQQADFAVANTFDVKVFGIISGILIKVKKDVNIVGDSAAIGEHIQNLCTTSFSEVGLRLIDVGFILEKTGASE